MMRDTIRRINVLPLLTLLLIISSSSPGQLPSIPLPAPASQDTVLSIDEVISARRSVRSFSESGISLEELSGLLFAAQGVTSTSGFRTAPSAGATYPLFIYVAVLDVDSLQPGIYLYVPGENSLSPVAEGNRLPELGEAAHGQPWVSSVPAVIAITADFSRTTSVYGERGESYVYIEVGHAAQNLYLTCTALGLGTVAVGAFDDQRVVEVLELPDDRTPVYLMPVGEPAVD